MAVVAWVVPVSAHGPDRTCVDEPFVVSTTRYLDYAVSDRLFHWESQANTATASETGQRYVHHINRGVSVVLFIRQSKNEGSGRTMPYFNAGTATYIEHRNERPMQVTWRLDEPLPGDTFASYRAAIA